MKFSFVIPVFNAEKTISNCVHSIHNSIINTKINQQNFEIIAVDNNSNDSTSEILKSLPCSVLIEKNQGRSYARNTGANASKGDYIIFVDSDVVIDVNFVNKLIEYTSSYEFDAGECEVENVSSNEIENAFDVYRKVFRGGRFNLNATTSSKFPIINTSCCVYKKSSFQAINGFDVSLNWFEDADLSKRLFLSNGNLIALEGCKAKCFFTGGLRLYLKRKYKSGIIGIPYFHKWNKELDRIPKVFNLIIFTIPHSAELKEYSFFTKIQLYFLFYISRVLTFIGHCVGRINIPNSISHMCTSKLYRINDRILNNEKFKINPELTYIKTPEFLILKKHNIMKMIQTEESNSLYAALFQNKKSTIDPLILNELLSLEFCYKSI